MTDKEKMLGDILSQIADELNITDEMYDRAVKSYETVGKWLADGIQYSVKIMPQGSMNLGTVVRPLDESDDYDMDLVCLLENGSNLPLKDIKSIVGNRLKENKLYRSKLEEEGKRCWTMEYEIFHMDILPCVPKDTYFLEPYMTSIKLTHKLADDMYVAKYSDPYAYHKWFESRMKDILLLKRQEYSYKNKVDIDSVPTYKVKTPLQKVIQLLKRHRDLCFENDDDAPISIIITTLAAMAYNGEENVYEALLNILDHMSDYIELRGVYYWIENPVIREENFAEKWNEDINKRKAYFNWIKQAKNDLISNTLTCVGIDAVAASLKKCLGKAPVERAIRAMGEKTRIARQNNGLFVNGLSGGLTTVKGDNKPVKEHTFFGK